jgi:hypothetical protein
MSPGPTVSQRVLESLLRSELAKDEDRRLVLVHGTYEPGARTEFKADIGSRTRQVRVSDQPSVLGITAAWLEHQDRADESSVLVVTTEVDDSHLDWDLRGHALKQRTLPVDPAEVVKQRFGAGQLDNRIWRQDWLMEALLAAEPVGGWPRTERVLTYDAAMLALVEQRLGVDNRALDMDRLLAWTRNPTGPGRFRALGNAERTGITEWLVETVGAAAQPLLALVEKDRGEDAMALGVIGRALDDKNLPSDAVLAVGGLFGQIPAPAVRAFSAAVDATLTRWISAAEREHRTGQSAVDVLDVVNRADALAEAAGLQDALSGSPLLPSAFRARLRAFGTTLPSVTKSTAALAELTRHRLARLFAAQVEAAEMAVRLARWLETADQEIGSVRAGVHGHVAEWGWVDRALSAVWAGDAESEPVSAQAYRQLCTQAAERREQLDQQFAAQLQKWSPHASSQGAQGCLLVEDVLRTVARPLASKRPPLVLLLDGMSSAVAAELGDEIARHQHWHEAGLADGGRFAAVSALPSVTRVSRASLLSGAFTEGGQAVEKDGFAAFWKRPDKSARLFHMAEIAGVAGQRLSSDIVSALAGDHVVGAVLNTIDDALDHGREASGASWSLNDIRFLPELLAQASSYGRPVLLVADHGHVLERGASSGPVEVTGDHGARWRTGTAGDGEVEVSGPRVAEGGGRVVLPWRESIRYANRRAGYHGGAALAEVTVPMLVLLPSADLLPSGWELLAPESVRPQWWQGDPTPVAATPEPVAPAPTRTRRKAAQPEGPGLFDVEKPVQRPELGQRVVSCATYQSQKSYVRKAPDAAIVAAVIDALAKAGGTMSLTAVAANAGRAARNIDGFLATVQRLLNVEGYPVFEIIDSGRNVRLNFDLLREQFGLGGS